MTNKRTDNGWGARHGTKWSVADTAKLVRWRLESHSWDDISERLKRSKHSCQVKYHYETHGGRKYAVCRDEVRIARKLSLGSRTDLTGIICGDPAPGRSALESAPRRKRPISLAPISIGASP